MPYFGPGGAGTPGATGATGPAGSPGTPGDDGPDGSDGPPGAAGTAGAAGAPGAAGISNVPGPPGEDGDDGAIGPPGPPGPTGATGSAGSGGVAVASVSGSGSADYTTTSTTFADVDAALAITPTNAQTGDVLEIAATFNTDGGNTGNAGVTFGIAGTDVGDTLGIIFLGAGQLFKGTMLYRYTMPSGTQPAIKLRWKTASGTLSIYNRTAVVRPYMAVRNLSRGGVL